MKFKVLCEPYIEFLLAFLEDLIHLVWLGFFAHPFQVYPHIIAPASRSDIFTNPILLKVASVVWLFRLAKPVWQWTGLRHSAGPKEPVELKHK
jgi:hypothetical protein